MKKQLASLAIVAVLSGCATSSHKVSTTDPTTKVTTTTVDKSSQSDNAALNFLSSTVKIGGDLVTAILPPFIPVIVGGLTHPVTTTPAAPASATP